MVVEIAEREQTDRLLFALSDHTRRDIVRRSLGGEHSVSTLASAYDMSFAAVQKHVAVLERADLIRKRRHGREQLVSSNIDAVRAAAEALDELEQIWRSRIDRIDDLLAADVPATGTHPEAATKVPSPDQPSPDQPSPDQPRSNP